MKKSLLILVVIPLIYSCKYEWEHISDNQIITFTLNQNSTSGPPLNDSIIFKTSQSIGVPENIPDLYDVTINSLKLNVVSYECSFSEIYCNLLLNRNTFHGIETEPYPFFASTTCTREISEVDFLRHLESELESKGSASFDFQTKLPMSINNFEIELKMEIDMTISY